MRQTKKRETLLKAINKNKVLFLMMLPGLVYFFIFRYIPMYGVIIAFKNYNLRTGVLDSPFASPWYKFFQTFFQSPYCWNLLSNTIVISVSKLVFGTLFSLALAIFLSECYWVGFKRVIQTLTYIPHFLSWVIIYGISLSFLSQSTGLINRWIMELGGKSIPFLTSVDYFRQVLVGTHIWQSAGWGAIIYLAAITTIPPSLYEAATIDGIGRIGKIFYITLPSIKETIIILLILNIGQIMNAGFEQIYVMYNVQVYQVADILDTWVYRTGLEQLNFSLASAVGTV